MENIKITAQTLEAAGFTETQIDRYFKLLDRKKLHGYNSLTVSDRQFINSARTAVAKVEAAHKVALAEGRKNRLSGKTPVETKKHYLWVQAEINSYIDHADLAADEILCHVLINNEILRALSLYQPTLDRTDTVHRFKFSQPCADLADLGNAYTGSRVVEFDHVASRNQLRSEFENEWNTRWDSYFENIQMVAISLSDELDYISFVRPEIERLTREIYPSVTATV
jgi:hypothetical protein